jgi:hypothetical protein
LPVRGDRVLTDSEREKRNLLTVQQCMRRHRLKRYANRARATYSALAISAFLT